MAGVGDIHKATWAFIALASVAWVLAFVGLAGLQAQCYYAGTLAGGSGGGGSGGGGSVFAGDLPMMGIRGLNRTYSCTRLYSYYWFMLVFMFVMLAGLTAMLATGLLAASALSWLAWSAVLAMLFIQGSDTFLAIAELGLSGSSVAYSRLAAAGWILSAIALLALLFLLGWRPRRAQAAITGGPIKY